MGAIMSIELDFDEALYIYNLLRSCDGANMPDELSIEQRLRIVSSELKERITDPVEFFTKFTCGEKAESVWIACQFYARIVPKLLKEYPELYRMREQ